MASARTRGLHPMAWWAWALGLATAASRTTNLLLLGLILAVVLAVVLARRPAVPWALGLRAYLWLAAAIVVLRVVFRVLLGADVGPTVLFTLPELPLPDIAAGIRIGGPVSLEGLVASLQDGVRLATLVLCVGAANLLADPKRLLRSLPSALHEVGATVVVALTIAPQLVESLQRVRRARRLRGGGVRGLRALRSLLMPVLEDALDRSLELAAAMDARGYGRSRHVPPAQRRLTAGLLLAGVMGVCVGLYGLLDGSAPRVLATPMLLGGSTLAAIGMALAGRRVQRSVHRPDRWGGVESLVAGLGVLAASATVLSGRADPLALFPPAQPLTWPQLPVLAGAAVLVALLASWVTPAPPSSSAVVP